MIFMSAMTHAKTNSKLEFNNPTHKSQWRSYPKASDGVHYWLGYIRNIAEVHIEASNELFSLCDYKPLTRYHNRLSIWHKRPH